jgi:hypothetical protein
MAVPRRVTLTGGLADGSRAIDRHGLTRRRPYRWRGIPGWNPAAVLDSWRSAGRMNRRCGYCGARPGVACRNLAGQVMTRAHGGR